MQNRETKYYIKYIVYVTLFCIFKRRLMLHTIMINQYTIHTHKKPIWYIFTTGVGNFFHRSEGFEKKLSRSRITSYFGFTQINNENKICI